MKKFAALVLAGAMTLGLAACGGGNTSTPAASSTPDASTPATSTPLLAPVLTTPAWTPWSCAALTPPAWAPLPSSWASWLPRRWTPSLAAS